MPGFYNDEEVKALVVDCTTQSSSLHVNVHSHRRRPSQLICRDRQAPVVKVVNGAVNGGVDALAAIAGS